jgi:hypothetical protein
MRVVLLVNKCEGVLLRQVNKSEGCVGGVGE